MGADRTITAHCGDSSAAAADAIVAAIHRLRCQRMSYEQVAIHLGKTKGFVLGRHRRWLARNPDARRGLPVDPLKFARKPRLPIARMASVAETRPAATPQPPRPSLVLELRREEQRMSATVRCCCGKPGNPVHCDRHAATLARIGAR